MTMVITSLQHEQVKKVVRLHTAIGRKEENLFLVEGAVFIESFKKYGYVLIALYCTQQAYEKKPISLGNVHFVSENVMKKMSQAVTPSGYIGIFEKPFGADWNTLSSGLVLAQISDPGNMGTLIRSAAAFGYKSVVIVEGCDPFSYKVIQATAGTLPLVSLFICSWTELVDNYGDFKLVALVTQKGQEPSCYDDQATLFVVGNEAKGLPQEWVRQCHNLCTLPMSSTVESLNASVAGSLVLAMAKKQA